MFIREKMDLEKETNTFRRINAVHPLDIFIGYNENNNSSMVITLFGGVKKKIQSSQSIQVDLYQVSDSKIRIAFSLMDKDKETIFYKFCEDIIESTKLIDEDQALNFIVSRWNKWRFMFMRATGDLLTENQVVGLLGELIFLDKYMIPKYGDSVAIESWNGPSKSHKDFEVGDLWHEVKTIKQAALTVKISSIEQLDSAGVGYLEVITVNKTNSEVEGAITLNKYVEYVGNRIMSFETYKKFYEKLLEAGYFYDEDYDKYIFKYVKSTTYLVTDDFPRIESKGLREGIVKVSYDILLKDINKFIRVNK